MLCLVQFNCKFAIFSGAATFLRQVGVLELVFSHLVTLFPWKPMLFVKCFCPFFCLQLCFEHQMNMLFFPVVRVCIVTGVYSRARLRSRRGS